MQKIVDAEALIRLQMALFNSDAPLQTSEPTVSPSAQGADDARVRATNGD